MNHEHPPVPDHSEYTDASNAQDVKAILECFADDAVVRDENATHRDDRLNEGCNVCSFAMRPLSDFLRQQRQRIAEMSQFHVSSHASEAWAAKLESLF